ncbi:hypothetical protein H9185_001155 [Listeria monocytogenes]|nr:hypothetical protein [Listeria monocytogenes]
MIDQLIIGNKASYDDFEASVKERKHNKPKKKSIKETIPFSNVTYDFSAINGEVYWEESTLEYVFEITADTAEELEEKKLAFTSWIMNVMEEPLHDPFIRDFHFIGTYDDIDIDDSEVEKSTITVTFTAYPYMIANKAKNYPVVLEASKEATLTVHNNSSHRITPTFNADVAFTVAVGDSNYAIPSGETKDDSFKLAVGATVLKFNSTESGSVNISFYEEVF